MNNSRITFVKPRSVVYVFPKDKDKLSKVEYYVCVDGKKVGVVWRYGADKKSHVWMLPLDKWTNKKFSLSSVVYWYGCEDALTVNVVAKTRRRLGKMLKAIEMFASKAKDGD